MLKRLMLAGLMFASSAGAVSGCVVRERTVASRPGPGRCPGGYWVEGHQGRRGWHAGHWHCPGIVERFDID
jgi:hypothetical protein